MALPILMIVLGLLVLIWSADLFVEGAVAIARHWGMSPLLIGMLVVGFGTSAPELSVSALSALQGNPGIALGNGYGSNIANIALILGVTAMICPITVKSQVIKTELPILLAATLLVLGQIYDGDFSRLDALLELLAFGGVITWMTKQSLKPVALDNLAIEIDAELKQQPISLFQAWIWLLSGLILLLLSSRMLVWGAVSIATELGVSDLIIGLTVVAIGTSLPELAASIVAARKGEHDLAVGNVLGSNLFNTLAVVGLAGVIQPMQIPADILNRDWPVMALLSLILFAMGYARHGDGRITRFEGGTLLTIYTGYTLYLIHTVMSV